MPERGHAETIAAVALAATAASLAGPDPHPGLVAAGFVAGVAVVGLPHGGLDHLVGEAALRPVAGPWWPVLFFAGYLSVATAVVLGWWHLPVATALLFFALSALHFTETESGPFARRVLLGSMVIWLPLLARPGEAATLLGWVSPTEADFHAVLHDLRPALAVLAAVTALVTLATATRADPAEPVRVAAFALMLALAPVLVSFSVVFCGWHSAQELLRLARRADPASARRGLLRVAWQALPASLGAVALTVGVAVLTGVTELSVPTMVQGGFLGLSAVAVPHILLHRLHQGGGPA